MNDIHDEAAIGHASPVTVCERMIRVPAKVNYLWLDKIHILDCTVKLRNPPPILRPRAVPCRNGTPSRGSALPIFVTWMYVHLSTDVNAAPITVKFGHVSLILAGRNVRLPSAVRQRLV